MHVRGVAVFFLQKMQTIVCVASFYFCVSSFKKFCLGTSKCHDQNTSDLTLHQPIRLQYSERGNKKAISVDVPWYRMCEVFSFQGHMGIFITGGGGGGGGGAELLKTHFQQKSRGGCAIKKQYFHISPPPCFYTPASVNCVLVPYLASLCKSV